MITNLNALLDTISRSEGTYNIGDNGYNVLVGSTQAHPYLFTDYADHPRILVPLKSGIKSSAAGRYQILERTFDEYKKCLDLPDFSPLSQDKIAVRMIKDNGAADDILAGNFTATAQKIGNLWASFPDNDYGQAQHTMDQLTEWYKEFGGQFSS